jgi:hypothetical protein
MRQEQEVVVTVGRNPLSLLSILRMVIAWFILGAIAGGILGNPGLGLVLVGVILGIMWIAAIGKYFGGKE